MFLANTGPTENVIFAPWHDPTWTIATHCSAREFCEREPDWYFDMHRPELFRSPKNWNEHYYSWLKHLQTPIFMQERYKEIPMAVRYPIERVLQEIRAYFTNHAAFMIALAMQEGVKTIGIFGCQYSADTEHSTQRGSLEYWLGRFEQYGGEVVLPVKYNTVLNFPSTLYGYESHDEKGNLCGDYKPKPRIRPAGAKPGHEVPAKIGPLTPEARASVKSLPNGDAPDWARYERLYGKDV